MTAPDDRFFALGVDRNLQYEESDGHMVCMGTLRFKWDIKSSRDDDAAVVASVEGAMEALATCPSDMAEFDVVKKTLAANTLSYIWSRLRTIVEQLSAQSTTGALSLPAIDPVELIED